MKRQGIAGLRTNAFAVLVMLLLEFCLGTGLYGSVPDADRGRGLFSAYGAAVVSGPVMLSLHAILGSLIVVSAVLVLVRSVLLRTAVSAVLGGVGLAAVVVAWLAGSGFASSGESDAARAMELATAVALFCYALVLFLLAQSRQPAEHQEARAS